MLTPRPRCHPLALALALAALPACAGGAKSSKVAAADEPLPGDVDGTIALLDRAESDLTVALGPEHREGAAQAAPDAAATPAPPPAPLPEVAPSQKKETEADRPAATAAEELQQAPAAQPSPCATACRALASMRRASEHLCALAGDGDPRCGAARERVHRADERVREACPACGD